MVANLTVWVWSMVATDFSRFGLAVSSEPPLPLKLSALVRIFANE
jgi:hypothetical protein